MDFEELLINEVHLNPILCDKRRECYKNRLKTDQVWESIATKLKKPKEAVKSRWKGLRDVFQKEVKKLPKPRSGEEGSPSSVNYTGKWPHFYDMWFLKDVMTPRLTQHNYSDDQEPTNQTSIKGVNIDAQEQSLEDGALQPISQATLPAPQQQNTNVNDSPPHASQLLDISESQPLSNKRISRKRRVTPPDMTEFQRKMLQVEQEKIVAFKEKHVDTVTNADEEDTLFLKSLAPYFKGLNPLNKLRLRSKIQDLIADEIASSSTASSSPSTYVTTAHKTRTNYQLMGYQNSIPATEFTDLLEETVSEEWSN